MRQNMHTSIYQNSLPKFYTIYRQSTAANYTVNNIYFVPTLNSRTFYLLHDPIAIGLQNAHYTN